MRMLDGGYPTQEWLASITADESPYNALLNTLTAWDTHYGSMRVVTDAAEKELIGAVAEDCIRLATGGWSGNESLIHALQANRVAWLVLWQLSAKGGLYILRIPTVTPGLEAMLNKVKETTKDGET